MHDIHQAYAVELAHPKTHTLANFFGLLSALDEKEQHEIVLAASIWMCIFEKPEGDDCIGFLRAMSDQASGALPELFVTRSLVLDILTGLAFGCNPANKSRWLESNEAMYQAAKEDLEAGTEDPEMMRRIMDRSDKKIDDINPAMGRSQYLYNLFCEKVVAQMFLD